MMNAVGAGCPNTWIKAGGALVSRGTDVVSLRCRSNVNRIILVDCSNLIMILVVVVVVAAVTGAVAVAAVVVVAVAVAAVVVVAVTVAVVSEL